MPRPRLPATKNGERDLKINRLLSIVALIVLFTLGSATAQDAKKDAAKDASPAAAKKQPMAKSKAEYAAYVTAAAETDPAKAEAAANDFADKNPKSELRPLLYHRTMGLYQGAGNQAKTLEMARTLLKYEPDNSVALITAAQILANAKDADLDKNARLAEADADARSALLHVDELPHPAAMTSEQFAEQLSQLKGMAHEVLGLVAFKKLDYSDTVKEYNLAVAEEKSGVENDLWLRLAIAHDKNGEYPEASEAVNKAIAGSQAGTQIRTLAEQEKAHLDKITVGLIK